MKGVQRVWHFVGLGVLATWAVVMLYFFASGRLINYLDTPYREFVLAGGVVLLVLVFFNAMTAGVDIEGCEGEHAHDCCGHDHGDDHHHHAHDHDHDHGHRHEDKHDNDHEPAAPHEHGAACGHAHDSTFDGGIVAALILVAPLLWAAVYTPDSFSKSWYMKRAALAMSATEVPEGMETLTAKKEEAAGTGAAGGGADAGGGYGAFTLQDLESLVEKSPAGNYMLTIQEIFYTAGDTEIQNVLKGLPVETIGQVLPDTMNDPMGRKLKVFRLFVQCCAADARPLSVTAEFPEKAPPFKEMGWYKVSGTMDFTKENGLTAPVIHGLKLEEVPEPEDRMLY